MVIQPHALPADPISPSTDRNTKVVCKTSGRWAIDYSDNGRSSRWLPFPTPRIPNQVPSNLRFSGGSFKNYRLNSKQYVVPGWCPAPRTVSPQTLAAQSFVYRGSSPPRVRCLPRFPDVPLGHYLDIFLDAKKDWILLMFSQRHCPPQADHILTITDERCGDMQRRSSFTPLHPSIPFRIIPCVSCISSCCYGASHVLVWYANLFLGPAVSFFPPPLFWDTSGITVSRRVFFFSGRLAVATWHSH